MFMRSSQDPDDSATQPLLSPSEEWLPGDSQFDIPLMPVMQMTTAIDIETGSLPADIEEEEVENTGECGEAAKDCTSCSSATCVCGYCVIVPATGALFNLLTFAILFTFEQAIKNSLGESAAGTVSFGVPIVSTAIGMAAGFGIWGKMTESAEKRKEKRTLNNESNSVWACLFSCNKAKETSDSVNNDEIQATLSRL